MLFPANNMQPLRSFPGTPNDKDLYTFMPAHASEGVLLDSSRNRRLVTSDSQIITTPATMGYDSVNHNLNLAADHLRGKEFHQSVPASSPRVLSMPGEYTDNKGYGNQNTAGASWKPGERSSYASRSECFGDTCMGQLRDSHHKDSSSLFHSVGPGQSSHDGNMSPMFHSASLAQRSLKWSPLVSQKLDHGWDSDSNVHLTREQNASHYPQASSNGQEKPVLVNIGLDATRQTCKKLDKSQSLESSSNIQDGGCTSAFASVDCSKISGDEGGCSVINLAETNKLLQQTLRLLSGSSGVDLTVNQSGSGQVCEGDVETTNNLLQQTLKLLSASGVGLKVNHSGSGQVLGGDAAQNILHSSTETSVSKTGEPVPNVDKSDVNNEKVWINLEDEPNSETGDSEPSETLWDGTLQLTSSVKVPAIAIFKSGEKMVDFCWPGPVEVEGKVKLEAFEKFLQDLPHSRSRGLMVMSLSWKEDSSDASRKGMKEAAKKYKETKRIGVAKLSKNVSMYICPHSDATLAILEKHGVFKGKTAVKVKSDPLIGCVTWRKDRPAPATKTTKVCGQQSGPLLSCPLESAAEQFPHEKTEIIQTEAKGGENCIERISPNSSSINQSKQSMFAENSLTAIFSSIRQLLELKTTNVEPNVPLPPAKPTTVSQSAVFSGDDDDLPEYDYGATVSQVSGCKTLDAGSVGSKPGTEQFKDSHVHGSISSHMKSESLYNSGPPPGFHFQGIDPQNIKRQSELQLPVTLPSLAVEETKQTVNCRATLKHKNLFDEDDDMPEWSPPDFKKMRPIENTTGSAFASTHSVVPRSDIPNYRTEHLPSLTPPPPASLRPGVGQSPALGHSAVPRPSFANASAGNHLNPPLPPGRPPQLLRPHPPSLTPPLPSSLPPPPPTLTSPPALSLPPPPATLTQDQFHNKDGHTARHLPNQRGANFMLEKPASGRFMHNSSAAPATLVQSEDRHYPPDPSLLLPRADKSAVDGLAHGRFMHYSTDAPTTMVLSEDRHYPPDPRLQLPRADKPAVDGLAYGKFMHNCEDAPTTLVQSEDRHYPLDPRLQLPRADKPAVDGLSYSSPDLSSQVHFCDTDYLTVPPPPPPPFLRPPAERAADSGSVNLNPHSPRFTPKSASMPQFCEAGMNNHIHRSARRDSRWS